MQGASNGIFTKHGVRSVRKSGDSVRTLRSPLTLLEGPPVAPGSKGQCHQLGIMGDCGILWVCILIGRHPTSPNQWVDCPIHMFFLPGDRTAPMSGSTPSLVVERIPTLGAWTIDLSPTSKEQDSTTFHHHP